MKLLVTDLDGTLLGKDKSISPGVHRAVERWKAAGNALVIATGRLYPSAAFYRDELKMQRELICSSGAVIYREGETLLEHTLPSELVERMWAVAEELGVYAQFYSHNYLIANREGDFMRGYARSNQLRSPGHRVLLEVRPLPRISEPVHKLSFVTHDPRQAEEVLRRMQPLEGVHVFRSLPHLYDIISSASSKGTGAVYLKHHFGAERVYGIGDNENDVELLRMADHSACMAGAPEEVRRTADVVVPDAEEDGVAVYLDAILGGRY